MKNILVAYDGGAPAHRALETGIELAKRFDASLAVVSVIPAHPGRDRSDPWIEVSAHDAQLREAGVILARHGMVAEMIEPTGEPALRHRTRGRDGTLRHDRRRLARSRYHLAVPEGQRLGARCDPLGGHGRHRPVSGPRSVGAGSWRVRLARSGRLGR